MEASQQHNIPPEVQEMADRLGVDVKTIMAQIHGPAQESVPADVPLTDVPPADVPVTDAAPVEGVPVGDSAPLAEAAPAGEAVSAGAGETETERLQRELAESRQETQQVRKLAQTAESGRVVGSGGVGVPRSVEDLPNLGSIEPGLRYDYLNGNITDEQLAERLSPLLAALLKKHAEVGGSI